jgi:hypothetical protein
LQKEKRKEKEKNNPSGRIVSYLEEIISHKKRKRKRKRKKRTNKNICDFIVTPKKGS